ncbi:BamA/TamA family outer membrane protein [bacterium SCSIO 12741]|nr:BamA/TamA family outer membrane protein [bacterium SCSIO 12741]
MAPAALKRVQHIALFLILAASVLQSCKPTKLLKEGEYLLDKTNLVVKGDKEVQKEFRDNVDVDALNSIIKQKPNRKLLNTFKFHLQIYTYGAKKNNWFRRWLKKIGEPPVIYDSVLTRKSEEQLNLYLQKKGYFLSRVTDSVAYQYKIKKDSIRIDKKKVIVTYEVHPGPPYKVMRLARTMHSNSIQVAFDSTVTENGLIVQGKNYDESSLRNERDRIERAMKNKGFYNFGKQYIRFEVDSTVKKERVKVTTVIDPPEPVQIEEQGKDTVVQRDHQKYYIKDMFVVIRTGKNEGLVQADTVLLDSVNFVNYPGNAMRPNVILRTLYFRPGDLYRLEDIEYSYNRLANLKVFRLININVFPHPDDPNGTDLRAVIDLSPGAKQSFTVETEGTNRGGNLGINGSVKLTNRNVLKGAELFEVKILGGLEAQNDTFRDNSEESQFSNLPFNTLEYGAEMTLRVPDLLIPKKKNKTPGYEKPNTAFSLGYNYQLRSAYKRDVFAAVMAYNWFLKRRHGFRLAVVDLSYISIDKADWFQERLIESKNSLLINSYQNHLISATNLSYQFTNQKSYDENYFFFRTMFESAGNLLRLTHDLTGRSFEEGTDYYTALGVRYAQYLKMDADIRLYNVITDHTRSVYRFYGGVGVTLQNLNVLPFEKSFYGGGANNNRAWLARSMGPGSMSDTLVNVDRIGDMKLELNWEYRFQLIGSLEGAYFIDASNVWLLKKDSLRPGAEFAFDRFYNEFAIGSGLGLRVNLSFFILRLDGGIKVHDPVAPRGERWIWQSKDQYNEMQRTYYENNNLGGSPPSYRTRLNLNLAISYPF